jgi:hypothetical protein
VANAKTGEQLYYNTFITNHLLSPDNVAQVAQAGRGRWKSENENNNVLKTKGYHLEHNFGHGKQYLSATMLSLNLLAFLFHTVMQWSDEPYVVLRQTLVRRQTFFDDIRTLTRYMVFESWHQMNRHRRHTHGVSNGESGYDFTGSTAWAVSRSFLSRK